MAIKINSYKNLIRLSLSTFLLMLTLPCNAVTELPSAVKAALDRFKLNGDGLSIHVQAVNSEQPLLSYHASVARNPASTIKLLTTYSALELLTPAYRWTTNIYADGEISNGKLQGNLWIKGSGDPYLPIERLWLLVHQLRNTGLNEISGDLIIDQSYFAKIDEDPNAFDGQGLRAYNVVPAAFVSNFNVSRFLFTPNKRGNTVDVQVIPDLPKLRIKNRLKIRKHYCAGYQRGVAMQLSNNGTVQLDGKFPSGCKVYSMARSVFDKDVYSAELFRKLWRESGGIWNGKLQHQIQPTKVQTQKFIDKPLLAFDSLALAEVVRSINKYSNNLMTRMLFLTLGAEKHNAPATTNKSRQEIINFLHMKNINTTGLHIQNGAGSARNTRISANTMNQVLQTAWHSPYMPELLGSMSITGQDGTFARRHEQSPLNGQGHLKTGRLDHVVAMAGYLQSRKGTRYVIVTLHNKEEVHRGSGHAVQDALLRWVYEQ